MKKDKKLYRLLAIVCGICLVLILFGVPINNSLSKGYWVLFRNSNICTRSQSWAGMSEHPLIQKEIKRVALKSRLLGKDDAGLQKCETPFGLMWFPGSSAEWTVHFALAQMEFGAYPDERVSAADIVLDCGGYVGDWAKWALKAGVSKVVIFEPAAEALECIHRNLAEEIRRGRVPIYPKAVGDSEGTLDLKHAEDNPAASISTGSII